MQRLTGLWGLAGVGFLFCLAIVPLAAQGLRTVGAGLPAIQWFSLVVLGGAFWYGEGVRSLQRIWIPGLLRRARGLALERSPVYHVLAPLYAMSLIGAPAPSLRRSWALAAMIAVAAELVGRLPDPWRGIIDLSVAGALSWALGFIIWGAKELATDGGRAFESSDPERVRTSDPSPPARFDLG